MSRIVEWEGKYIRVIRDDRWEYVQRCRGIGAVVILAEHEGRVILVEQRRVPLDGRMTLELPAGLVGDEDELGIEATAVKELEEEAGFTAGRIEILGEFHSSPGLVSEGFTLVRAHGLRQVGPGGGNKDEQITVHLVAPVDIPAFVASKRGEGAAIDTKLLLLLAGSLVG